MHKQSRNGFIWGKPKRTRITRTNSMARTGSDALEDLEAYLKQDDTSRKKQRTDKGFGQEYNEITLKLLRVDKLQELLKSKGLSLTGNKAELIQRLLASPVAKKSEDSMGSSSAERSVGDKDAFNRPTASPVSTGNAFNRPAAVSVAAASVAATSSVSTGNAQQGVDRNSMRLSCHGLPCSIDNAQILFEDTKKHVDDYLKQFGQSEVCCILGLEELEFKTWREFDSPTDINHQKLNVYIRRKLALFKKSGKEGILRECVRKLEDKMGPTVGYKRKENMFGQTFFELDSGTDWTWTHPSGK